MSVNLDTKILATKEFAAKSIIEFCKKPKNSTKINEICNKMLLDLQSIQKSAPNLNYKIKKISQNVGLIKIWPKVDDFLEVISEIIELENLSKSKTTTPFVGSEEFNKQVNHLKAMSAKGEHGQRVVLDNLIEEINCKDTANLVQGIKILIEGKVVTIEDLLRNLGAFLFSPIWADCRYREGRFPEEGSDIVRLLVYESPLIQKELQR